MGRPANWKDHLDRIKERNGAQYIYWQDGRFTKIPPDDNPYVYHASGTRKFPTFKSIDPEKLYYIDPWHIYGISYPSSWDFEHDKRHSGNHFPPYINDTLKAVIAKTANHVSVHAELFSPFSQLLELLDYAPALMSLLTDPAKVHACLKALTIGTVHLGHLQAACGADAILISSAFAGSGFISREMYNEFVLPYENKVVQSIQASYDIPVYTHTCGGIGDRLDLMLQTGTNGIDTLDPPPLGTVELDVAIKKTKGQVFIKGNIDPVHEILQGSNQVIYDAVQHRMQIAKPGGRYIMSTACSVSPHTAPEKIEYFSKVANELGRYRQSE